MSSIEPRPPIHVGDVAPDFTLPTVQREGTVSLADYRDNSAVLLVLNRGLWCSFCRRYIVQLGGTWEHLQRLGVDMLAIVASKLERARFYVRARPIRVPMAADPELLTHRAYGLPMPPMTPEIDQTWQKMRVQLDRTAVTPADLEQLTAGVGAARDTAQPTGAMGGADQLPLWDFVFLQRRLYPYEMAESEQRAWANNITLGTGQFLIDQDGIVRWFKVQGTTQPPAGLGNYPSQQELLAAARTLSG